MKKKKEKRNYVDEINNGDFDDAIITSFRCGHFDLRQLTSGVSDHQHNSIFHKLARFIGLADSDEIASVLYRLLVLNQRGIRDQLDHCECCRGPNHYFATPINVGDVSNALMIPIEKIDTPNENVKIVQLGESSTSKRTKTNSKNSKTSRDAYISAGTNSESDEIKINKLKESVIQKISLKQPLSEMQKAQLNKAQNQPDDNKKAYIYKMTPPNLTQAQYQQVLNGVGVKITCPRCGETGETEVQYKMGCMTITNTIILSLLCLIPCALCLVVGNCGKDVMHICSNCKYIFGIVKNRPCRKSMDWNYEVDKLEMPQRFQASYRASIAARKNSELRKSQLHE